VLNYESLVEAFEAKYQFIISHLMQNSFL